jgi:hypothetical protein
LIIAANSGRSQLVDRESRVDCNFAESWYDFPQNKSAQRAGREICHTFQIVWGCCDELAGKMLSSSWHSRGLLETKYVDLTREAELNKKQAERKKQSYLRHGCGASLRQAAKLGQGRKGNKKEHRKKEQQATGESARPPRPERETTDRKCTACIIFQSECLFSATVIEHLKHGFPSAQP